MIRESNILAGDEFGTPSDYPSNRSDQEGIESLFNSVGSVEINLGDNSYIGSAVALSDQWILTAGHNVDIFSNGTVTGDTDWIFHLPDYGSFSVSEAYLQTDYTGFANPVVNDDLALFRLSESLPVDLNYWNIGSVDIGDTVSLVGYGRSGFGSYGYTSDASFSDRRIGYNTIDSFELDDEGSGLAEVYLYDFDNPASSDSLGNDLESIIGPGDSGGGAFIQNDDGSLSLVGINTFTEGSGGLFGDIGGGVLVDPYLPWIQETTQLYSIPEPSTGLYLCFISILMFTRKRRH